MSHKVRAVKSLRSYLIRLVLVAVVPLLLVTIGLLVYVTSQQNKELENKLSAQAFAVRSVVDDKLNSVATSLRIFSYTEEFDPKQFKILHQKLSRAIQKLEGWECVAVVDSMGNQLLNTSTEFGMPAPTLANEDFFQEALLTGRPAFSNFRIDPITQKRIFSVALHHKNVKNQSVVLIADISLDSLGQTIKGLNIDPDWTATVLDRNFIIMARTRKADMFVGVKAAPIVIDKVSRSQTGVLESINKEGIKSYSVYTHSQDSNWVIVLGLPIVQLSLFSNLAKGAFFIGLFFVCLGIFLAMRMGATISAPIHALSKAADDFGKGYLPLAVDSEVSEVRDLAKSMVQASSQRIKSEQTIRTLHEISSSLAGELDLKKLLQSFTDQATQLTRAEFGAYFDTTDSQTSDFFDVVTLSGMPLEKFSHFPLPRKTEIFAPTLRGEGIIRLDDVTKDPRYGKNVPYHGVPEGHLPVRSYLAVPITSRTGEVLGALFFGHSQPGIFTEQDEKLLGLLVGQAATAIDNANLYAKSNQAIELRDTFLSVASHELKTPLTSIYLQFEILKRSTLKATENEPKIFNLFERFQSQLERLTRLINELLDVTRIASGNMDLNPEKMRLDKMVMDICANFESEAIQNGSLLSLEIQDQVESLWDANRIEQVLMNLISNAIKYGDKQPIQITVSKADKWAIIAVKDQGLGIAPADQGRIFQRFERATGTNTISGLGLGLFICKEIVLRHGGSIKLESTLGQGSTFTVKLPMT